MGCSSCQQNNHVVPSTYVHNPTTQTHCECACGCSEPVCPTLQPCTEITDSKCIIYTDAVIKCGNDTVVTQNASVSTALNQLTTYFCTQINEILNNPPTPAPEYTYEIGEYVESQGGVIFHRYKDGANENYLVVAKSNAATGASWDNNIMMPPLLGASSTWNGASNYLILGGSTGSQFTSAAYAVSMYGSVVPISGWYLPAIDELSLLWQNRFNVDRTLSGNSSFGIIGGATIVSTNNYWSSTEYVNISAWIFNFASGDANVSTKSNTNYVRAVRKFSL